MLVDHALMFSMVYQKYVSFLRGQSQDASLLPGYKVLGKELGDLLSSSCLCERIGGLHV